MDSIALVVVQVVIGLVIIAAVWLMTRSKGAGDSSKQIGDVRDELSRLITNLQSQIDYKLELHRQATETAGKSQRDEAAASRAELQKTLNEELGTFKVIANTDSRNQSSINLLLALGFEHQSDKSWSEEFKNEIVTVFCFEKTRS